MLMSCLDGSEGLTSSEWNYTGTLDGNKGTTINGDLKKIVQEGQKELYYQKQEEAGKEKETHYYDQGTSATNSTTGEKETITIKSGDTPIGLMKASYGEYSADDFNTLMQMNINAGNIKDTTMSEAQQEKYGVKYMLHPDMNIKMYSKEKIEEFKKTGKMPDDVIANTGESKETADVSTLTKEGTQYKDENGDVEYIVYNNVVYNPDGTISKYQDVINK